MPQQTTTNSFGWAQVNSVTCNTIYPISFEVSNTLSQAKIIAFDLQDFSNAQTQKNGNDQQIPADRFVYSAIMFVDDDGLKFGVTWQTERSFKWLILVKNALVSGQSTLKVSAQSFGTAVDTSVVPDTTNDSIITIAYELASDSSLVAIASFKYTSGALIAAHNVYKGGNIYATSVASRVVWQSPYYQHSGKSALATHKAIHFVFGFNTNLTSNINTTTQDAIEIQYQIDTPSTPSPFRVFNYGNVSFSSSSPQYFKNTNFSKVLGMSSMNFDQLKTWGKSLIFIKNTSLSGPDHCQGPGCGHCKISTDPYIFDPTEHPQPPYTFWINTYYHSGLWNLYFDSLQQNITAGKRWYYSATAFLNQRIVGSNYFNQVYWYVSHTDVQSNQQVMREYTYYFTTDNQLTSHVVSSNAPALCMTAPKSSSGTSLYLDDLQIVKELKLKIDTAAQQSNGICWLSTHFFNYDSPFSYPIGVKRFDISTNSVVCLAQNTQVEQHNWAYPSGEIYNNSACEVMTNILLQDQTQQVIFLVQMRFRRVKSINYDLIAQFFGDKWPDCSKYSPPTSQFYTAYKLPYYSAGNFFGFSPSLISSDSIVGGNDTENVFGGIPQFWFAGSYTKNSKTYFVIDTSVSNLRQSNITTTTDTITIKSVRINGWTDSDSNNFPDTTGFQLSQYTRTQTLINSMMPIMSDVSSSASSNFDYSKLANTKIDWSFNTKPAIQLLGLDQTLKNTMCLTLDPKFLNLTGQKISMGFDLDPVTNCKDRTYGSGFPNYFSAIVSGMSQLTANISDVTVSLNQSVIKPGNVPQIQISFVPQSTAYGVYDQKLNFTYQLGNDSMPFNWEQKVLVLDSCQPKNLEWSLKPSASEYPKSYRILIGQPMFVVGMPVPIFSSKTLNNQTQVKSIAWLDSAFKYNYYLYSVIDSKAIELNRTTAQYIYLQDGNLNVKFPVGSLGQSLSATFVIKAQIISTTKYFYYDSSFNGVLSSFVNITTSQPLFNFTVFTNAAPYFSAPLVDQTILAGQKLVYVLPNIVDESNFNAKLFRVQSVPSNSFSSYQISNRLTGNSITFSPSLSSKNQTYIYLVMLSDDAPVKKISTYKLMLTVVSVDVKTKTSKFNPFGDAQQYKADPGYQLTLMSVDTSGEASLLFSQRTNEIINLSYGQNITLINAVQNGYLQLKHFQIDVYSGVTKVMAKPTFNVTSFNGVQLKIKVNFTDQELLSTSLLQKIDKLQFYFNDTQIFCTLKFGIPSDLVWTFSTKLPVMKVNGNSQSLQSLTQATASVATGFQGLMTGNFILNVITAASMDKLWGTLNILQLVLHTPLLQIQLSDFAYGFCSALVNIVSFQIVSAAPLTKIIFGDQNFSPVALTPLNERFDLLGYSYYNIIKNMDLALYILFSFILTLPIFIFFNLLNRIYPTMPLKKLESYLQSTLKFSWFLRFFLESNFVLLITCQLQILAINQVTTWVDVFSNILSVIFVIILAAMPIFSYVVLNQLLKKQKLDDEIYKVKYGELYQAQLRKEVTKHQLLYNVYFMIRRILSYICIFFLMAVPAFQIGIQAFVCVVWCGYTIAERPFEDPDLNVIEVINNLLYWIILVFCYGLTFAVESKKTLDSLGYMFSALILLMLIVNVLFMLVGMMHQFSLKLKKFYGYMKFHYFQDNHYLIKKKIDIKLYRISPKSSAARQKNIQNHQQAIQNSLINLQGGQQTSRHNTEQFESQKLKRTDQAVQQNKSYGLQPKNQPIELLSISEASFEESDRQEAQRNQFATAHNKKQSYSYESDYDSSIDVNDTPLVAIPKQIQSQEVRQQKNHNNTALSYNQNAVQNVSFELIKPYEVKLQRESQNYVAEPSYLQEFSQMSMQEKIKRLNTNQNNQFFDKEMFELKTDRNEFQEPKFTIEQCKLRLQYVKSNVERTFWNKKLGELLKIKSAQDEFEEKLPNDMSFNQI